MAFRTIALTLLLACVAPLHAQTAFTSTLQPITLPGGRTTVMGTDAGMALTITPNFDLREENILAPSNGAAIFLGGFNYRLPILSGALNNASPTLNGWRFQFYVTASAGVNRLTSLAVSPSSTSTHFALLAGGGVNYALTATGNWTFGAEVRYAKLPGMANNTAVVSVGPSFHF